MQQSDQFWKYTTKPYGMYPVQAEGTLNSGEKFYFRLRWGYASLSISSMHEKHGLDNPIWESSVEAKSLKLTRTNKHGEEEPSEQKITECIEGLLMDYLLSVEGSDFDENEVVSLEKWRRRQHIKRKLEQS